MAKACFIVGGQDFSDLIPEGGIRWSRNDIDSAQSGRSRLTAKMYRKRLAIKRKLSIQCLRMTTAQCTALNKAICPETVSVKFLDPLEGGVVEKTFYGSTVEATTQITMGDETYWDDVSFNLTEV